MKILFIFLSFSTGFFIGVFYGSLTLSSGSGLAGPAIVLGNGVIGAIILLLLSLFLIKKLTPALLKKITIVLFVLNGIAFGWIAYQVISKTAEEPKNEIKRIPTESSLLPILKFFQNSPDEELGLGMAKPDFFKKKVLYFYNPNLEKPVSEHTPNDSIVFSQTEIGYEISYGPPWLFPEHLKMDYEILYLKIITLGKDWIEVEVNRQTKLSRWIAAEDAEIFLWPEFLLKVFSIENPDPKNNPLRIKPLSHASEFYMKDYSTLTPIMIKDSWIKVELYDDDFNKVGQAWLQWKKNGKLLISYSLLS